MRHPGGGDMATRITWLTTTEAAQRIGIQTDSLRTMIREGRMKHGFRVHACGRYYFDPDVINAMARAYGNCPNTDQKIRPLKHHTRKGERITAHLKCAACSCRFMCISAKSLTYEELLHRARFQGYLWENEGKLWHICDQPNAVPEMVEGYPPVPPSRIDPYGWPVE